MQITKPQVHLKKDNSTGTFYIHVVTWFDYTKFKANGYGTIPTGATDGTFSITLYVIEDSSVANMQLLTPVVHTVTLTGVDLSNDNPFIEINIVNSTDSSQVNKRKTHKDDADDSSMPPPDRKIRK